MIASDVSAAPLALIRRALRLSTVIRLLWIAVAALHAWLLMQRIVSGNLGDPLNFLKLVLGAGAIGYCTLKVWRVATLFDASPRRALCFALLLLFGHWLVASPETQHAYEQAPMIALTTLATLPVLEIAVGLLLLLAVRLGMVPLPQPVRLRVPTLEFQLHPWTQPSQTARAALWRRPPPTQA